MLKIPSPNPNRKPNYEGTEPPPGAERPTTARSKVVKKPRFLPLCLFLLVLQLCRTPLLQIFLEAAILGFTLGFTFDGFFAREALSVGCFGLFRGKRLEIRFLEFLACQRCTDYSHSWPDCLACSF